MYRFQVTAHTQMGESIAIVGSIPQLGQWDVSKSLPLHTDSHTYPLWWVEVDIPGNGQKVEYKYLKKKPDGTFHWECPGDNRWIILDASAEKYTIVVEDLQFGKVNPYPYGYWEKPIPTPPPKENGKRIVVIGSSVALGCSAWLLRGWAQLLKETLEEKYGYQLLNVSEIGANVTTTIKRFPQVVTPHNPEVVIISLSLGNEGFAYCPPHQRRALQQRFESGLQELIRMTREIGAIPILGSVYPHSHYTPEHNWLLYDTHHRMLSWGVPVLDWLTVLNDGNGRFAPGLEFDAAHPNSEGHRRMFSVIDITLFSPERLANMKAETKKKSTSPVRLYDKPSLTISYNPTHGSLLFHNTTNSPATISLNSIPPQLKSSDFYLLKQPCNPQACLFFSPKDNSILNIPPSTQLEYFPLSFFFSPTQTQVLFYDGNLAILQRDSKSLYLVNLSPHEYNVHPMWQEVSDALKPLTPGFYEDSFNPDAPFRTMIIGQYGLESRVKVPPRQALFFTYTCSLSERKRIAILPLGDRCAVRMLLHKMEYDGPAYPFDLTRTTNLSDVAHIIETGFEDMWNPAYLQYNPEHGRIYHTKWTGLSFAHEVEEGENPLENMYPILQRMKRRYQARAKRFWFTIQNSDEILFIRTGYATRGQVEDLMAKLKHKCQNKPFRLLILSEQPSGEFAGLENVFHENLYFNPDAMYNNLEYWLQCTEIMRKILNRFGISTKNLFWCPPNI